ncbi:hypothetical protein HYU19_05060 [Candidatus Woesearchaeota archaeon]|nr:hypothetical protein [Candidatus Woesearchaeota archaeon]
MTQKKQKKAERSGKGKKRGRTISSRGKRKIVPSIHQPGITKRLATLKSEDRILWDEHQLDKDNKDFLKLAASLKQLMVKKKRL